MIFKIQFIAVMADRHTILSNQSWLDPENSCHLGAQVTSNSISVSAVIVKIQLTEIIVFLWENLPHPGNITKCFVLILNEVRL